jgi:xylulokinase
VEYLIGVDIGTTGIKASLYDTEGHQKAEAFRELALSYPRSGWVEQNPDDFYTGACQCIAEMIRRTGTEGVLVKAVTIAGQMAGILGIGEDWRPVTHYDSWLDSRCSAQVRYIREQAEVSVLEKSGLPSMVAHCAKILWWKEERPETFKKIVKFIQPNAYVAGRMAGLKGAQAFIDYTYCHFTGLFDFPRNVWSEELCRLFDIPLEKLPRVCDPWEIVGELGAGPAAECALPAGIPVVAGCGDQAAGFLGAGLVEAGSIVDVAGTASVFACGVDRFAPDLQFRTLLSCRSVLPNLWFPHAFLTGGGLCLRWFRDNVVKPSPDRAAGIYRELDAAAERRDGPTGVLFLPHMSGRNFPFHEGLRGSFANMNWNTDNVTLYKSIMEGIAYEYSLYLKIERSIFRDTDFYEVRVYGGGARSALFTRIKADILGIPYVTLKHSEVGALGCVILGGYAAGIYKDMASASREFNGVAQRIEPDMQNHQRYRQYAGAYAEYSRVMEEFHSAQGGALKTEK